MATVIRNIFFGLAALMVLTDCTGLVTRSGKGRGESPGVLKTEEPPYASYPAETSKPAPAVPVEPPKVGVLLGPGGMKTVSQLGFLDELRKARIPISYIVGVEWGALMGALFAADGQSHAGEWWLYKLKNEDLTKRGMFSKQWSMQSVEEFLNSHLDNNQKSKRWGQFSIPFSCPSRQVFGGRILWQDAGEGIQDVSPCLAFPPLYKPADGMWAPISNIDIAVEQLRRRGAQLILVANVLDRGSLFDKSDVQDNLQSAMMWEEIRAQWIGFREKIKGREDFVWVDLSAPEQKLFRVQDTKSLGTRGREQGRRVSQELLKSFQF